MFKPNRNKSRVHPQLPSCKLSILVPAYNEEVETVNRLLKSLLNQRKIQRNDYEILIIVNNDLKPITSKQVFKNNQKILNTKWTQIYNDQLNISIYDHSTQGYEIPACNIGAARDTLLNHAYLRYVGNDYNGIIMHVDADIYVKDNYLLSKYIEAFEDNSTIGLVGGKWREVYTEDCTGFSHKAVKSVFETIGLSKQCKELSNFIKGKPVLDAFGGSNMLARCYESVKVGGFKHINLEEDKDFGYRLKKYADRHGMTIINKRTELKVVAEMRISARTGSSIANDVNTLLAGEQLYVKHPPNPKQLLKVDRGTYLSLIEQAKLRPGGNELVAYIEDYGQLWIRKSRKTSNWSVASKPKLALVRN